MTSSRFGALMASGPRDGDVSRRNLQRCQKMAPQRFPTISNIIYPVVQSRGSQINIKSPSKGKWKTRERGGSEFRSGIGINLWFKVYKWEISMSKESKNVVQFVLEVCGGCCTVRLHVITYWILPTLERDQSYFSGSFLQGRVASSSPDCIRGAGVGICFVEIKWSF